MLKICWKITVYYILLRTRQIIFFKRLIYPLISIFFLFTETKRHHSHNLKNKNKNKQRNTHDFSQNPPPTKFHNRRHLHRSSHEMSPSSPLQRLICEGNWRVTVLEHLLYWFLTMLGVFVHLLIQFSMWTAFILFPPTLHIS